MKPVRMKAKLLIIIATIALVACKKDSYTTRPQLSFKSVNGDVFGPNQAIIFSLEFTDKEGDVQDSIWVQKITRTSGCISFGERFKIPEFTQVNNIKGTFEVGYSTSLIPGSPYTVLPNCNKNDTCYFRFWVSDKAKNVSDTVVSPDIVVLRQ